MSVKLLKDAVEYHLQQHCMTGSEVALYMLLANAANDEYHCCYLSDKYLLARINLGARALRKTISALVDRGLIVVYKSATAAQTKWYFLPGVERDLLGLQYVTWRAISVQNVLQPLIEYPVRADDIRTLYWSRMGRAEAAIYTPHRVTHAVAPVVAATVTVARPKRPRGRPRKVAAQYTDAPAGTQIRVPLHIIKNNAIGGLTVAN